MRQLKRTALPAAAVPAALLWGGLAMAQSAQTPASAASSPPAQGEVTQVVITGQRAALQSAQKIKQNSDEIVDSIVADDIGKLPDRSVTEVLQRIVGVTISHTITSNDPEHYSVEGSGVNIRGLSYVRSELNGRDSFSANGGRVLNFEDLTPELMAGVDVYKDPSAEQIEGGIGSLVNLRTAMPFDFTGQKVSISLSEGYSTLAGAKSPKVSGLYSNRWDLGSAGQFGALIDVAHSVSRTRTDALQVDPYFNIGSAARPQWVPEGADWRRVDFTNKRNGLYAALQWKQDDISSSLTYFKSRYDQEWDENAIFSQEATPYNITVDPGATYDSHGALVKGTIHDDADGGVNFGADTRVAKRKSDTQDISWNVNWKANNRWTFNTDLQVIKATTKDFDSTVATGIEMAKETLDLSGGMPKIAFDSSDLAALANPANYYWAFTRPRDSGTHRSAGHAAGVASARARRDLPHCQRSTGQRLSPRRSEADRGRDPLRRGATAPASGRRRQGDRAGSAGRGQEGRALRLERDAGARGARRREAHRPQQRGCRHGGGFQCPRGAGVQ